MDVSLLYTKLPEVECGHLFAVLTFIVEMTD
jgi:hypothetical protein